MSTARTIICLLVIYIIPFLCIKIKVDKYFFEQDGNSRYCNYKNAGSAQYPPKGHSEKIKILSGKAVAESDVPYKADDEKNESGGGFFFNLPVFFFSREWFHVFPP